MSLASHSRAGHLSFDLLGRLFLSGGFVSFPYKEPDQLSVQWSYDLIHCPTLWNLLLHYDSYIPDLNQLYICMMCKHMQFFNFKSQILKQIKALTKFL